MKNTILNYFGSKSNIKSSDSTSKLQTASNSKRNIIEISSDEENGVISIAPEKKQKSLQVHKRKQVPVLITNKETSAVQSSTKKTEDSRLFSAHVSQIKENTKNNENVHSAVHDNSSSELPYYLKNFKLAIDTVMEDENDSRLFDGDDALWIKTFFQLPITCQKLYVRLFHRKHVWLPISKISYKEIGDDISIFLNTLVQAHFMECSITDDKTSLSLTEILTLLHAPVLKNLAKSFHISTSGSKDKILQSILDLSKKQRTVFGSTSNSLESAVIKRSSAALGPCYKLEVAPKKAFNRVLLVFDVTRGTEDDMEYSLTGSNQPPYFGKNRQSSQLSTILLAEMGQMVYPTYQIKKKVSVFETREELLEYETAYGLFNQIYAASENGQLETALCLCESASEISCSIAESSRNRSMSLPYFMRGFSASAVYVRVKSIQVEILQRLRDYTQAADILRSLIKEKQFCLSRRGYWYERLALNLDQHLHDHFGALQIIKNSLCDTWVRVGHVNALVERAQKLQASGKVKNFDFDTILNGYNFSKAREVTIVGRLLPKRMQTGQARFMKLIDGKGEDDVLLCSVEELALDHYKSEGYDQGIHGEGGTFTCFFCLLMWDIIFMDGIDDVFRTPYQTHPLDYNTDEFYSNRSDQIDLRIKLVKKWNTEDFCASEIITKHWNAYQGVACTGMNWERFTSLQQALSLAECIGGVVLGGIVEVLAKDPRHTRSGLPDLVVWNSSLKSYKLVEVKGPNDRLSNNQKMWMHRLVSMEANVEVCHVTASASRNLGL